MGVGRSGGAALGDYPSRFCGGDSEIQMDLITNPEDDNHKSFEVEKPIYKKDGSTIVNVKIYDSAGLFDNYFVRCTWDKNIGQWICSHLRHEYYESLHLGPEVGRRQFPVPTN